MTADRREFLRISQAVGMGFLIMGVIGYVVKLSMSPSDSRTHYNRAHNKKAHRREESIP